MNDDLISRSELIKARDKITAQLREIYGKEVKIVEDRNEV